MTVATQSPWRTHSCVPRRDDSRRGTQECVRHGNGNGFLTPRTAASSIPRKGLGRGQPGAVVSPSREARQETRRGLVHRQAVPADPGEVSIYIGETLRASPSGRRVRHRQDGNVAHSAGGEGSAYRPRLHAADRRKIAAGGGVE